MDTLVLILFILWAFISIWAIVDCIVTGRQYGILWITAIFYFPIVGASAYFITKLRAKFEPYKGNTQSYQK